MCTCVKNKKLQKEKKEMNERKRRKKKNCRRKWSSPHPEYNRKRNVKEKTNISLYKQCSYCGIVVRETEVVLYIVRFRECFFYLPFFFFCSFYFIVHFHTFLMTAAHNTQFKRYQSSKYNFNIFAIK